MEPCTDSAIILRGEDALAHTHAPSIGASGIDNHKPAMIPTLISTKVDGQALSTSEVPPTTTEIALSKNKLKKLKKDQAWEANRDKRKAKRKEKNQEKKARKRAQYADKASGSLLNKDQVDPTQQRNDAKDVRQGHTQLPITFIMDCSFDDLMIDKEIKSLSGQITRAYSDCHRARYNAHLAISSFGGHLKERFDGALEGTYHSWKNVRFLEEDFIETSKQAQERMKAQHGGQLQGAFANMPMLETAGAEGQAGTHDSSQGDIIYLTSDSEYTLTELRPFHTYIIGGLVDKNRHKGICYKAAMDRGIKTAKLPIGEHMKMLSRHVLATNHVVEIMLHWLECGDWGQAFLKAIPQRKGGSLKEAQGKGEDATVVRAAGDGATEGGSVPGAESLGEYASDEEVEDGVDGEAGPVASEQTMVEAGPDTLSQ